jgi:hypothetical protein
VGKSEQMITSSSATIRCAGSIGRAWDEGLRFERAARAHTSTSAYPV